MKFLDLAGFFLPKDNGDSTANVIVWRHKVAYSLAAVFMALMLLPVGVEFRYVDKAEAEEAHAAIENRLAGVESQLKTLTDQNNAEAIRDIRLQIYQLRERACRTQGELRNLLNEQVQGLRADYQAATNGEFPVISCAELIGVADEE